MKTFTAGQPAPKFTLNTVEGEPFSLETSLQAGQHVVLVFLRHLG
jgi:peroxiredoxin